MRWGVSMISNRFAKANNPLSVSRQTTNKKNVTLNRRGHLIHWMIRWMIGCSMPYCPMNFKHSSHSCRSHYVFLEQFSAGNPNGLDWWIKHIYREHMMPCFSVLEVSIFRCTSFSDKIWKLVYYWRAKLSGTERYNYVRCLRVIVVMKLHKSPGNN